MTEIPDEARAILESDALAHLVTSNADGSAQVSCVWVGPGGLRHRLRLAGPAAQARQHPPRPARDALAGGHRDRAASACKEYLVVHGRARIDEGGGPELLQHLAHTYLGPDVKFPPMDDPPPGVVVHIAVERLGGVGPWA